MQRGDICFSYLASNHHLCSPCSFRGVRRGLGRRKEVLGANGAKEKKTRRRSEDLLPEVITTASVVSKKNNTTAAYPSYFFHPSTPVSPTLVSFADFRLKPLNCWICVCV